MADTTACPMRESAHPSPRASEGIRNAVPEVVVAAPRKAVAGAWAKEGFATESLSLVSGQTPEPAELVKRTFGVVVMRWILAGSGRWWRMGRCGEAWADLVVGRRHRGDHPRCGR